MELSLRAAAIQSLILFLKFSYVDALK